MSAQISPNSFYENERDVSSRLLAFRLTKEKMSQSEELSTDILNLKRREQFTVIYSNILSKVSSLPPSSREIAELLLVEGFTGNCEELINVAILLDN